MSKEDVFDFCFYLLAIGIFGARLMYVLQEFDKFKGQLGSVSNAVDDLTGTPARSLRDIVAAHLADTVHP